MTQVQEGWRFCQKCGNMIFNEFGPGVCQAGGDHRKQGLLFTLPFDRVTSAIHEGRFFFCSKCHSMFQQHDFNGSGNDLGRCPKGGQHDRTDSIEFVLTHDAPVPDGQDRWVVCVQCHALFFGPKEDSKCPVEGSIGHSPGQGNFPIFNLPHSTNPADFIA
jgi:hypothetical protein